MVFFEREHPGLFCIAFAVLSLAFSFFLFRPFGWRQFFNRCPLFLATGGPLFLRAVSALPASLPKLFEWYLGHSIHEMVYEHERSGTVFGELWINRWQGYVGDVFACMILLGVSWAVVNLGRPYALRSDEGVNLSQRYATRSNKIALLLFFSWGCLSLWASAFSQLF